MVRGSGSDLSPYVTTTTGLLDMLERLDLVEDAGELEAEVEYGLAGPAAVVRLCWTLPAAYEMLVLFDWDEVDVFGILAMTCAKALGGPMVYLLGDWKEDLTR